MDNLLFNSKFMIEDNFSSDAMKNSTLIQIIKKREFYVKLKMDKVHNSFIIFVFTISGFKPLLKFLDIFNKSLYTFEFSLYNIVGENIYGLLQEMKNYLLHIL